MLCCKAANEAEIYKSCFLHFRDYQQNIFNKQDSVKWWDPEQQRRAANYAQIAFRG